MNPNLQVVELALFMGYRCMQRKGDTGQWLFKADSQPRQDGRIWLLERVVGEFEPAKVIDKSSLAYPNRDVSWSFGSIPHPDYLNDLNEMHKVAMKLKADSRYQYALYLSHLDNLVQLANDDSHLEDADAPQRAKAVLKTINKWTNDD